MRPSGGLRASKPPLHRVAPRYPTSHRRPVLASACRSLCSPNSVSRPTTATTPRTLAGSAIAAVGSETTQPSQVGLLISPKCRRRRGFGISGLWDCFVGLKLGSERQPPIGHSGELATLSVRGRPDPVLQCLFRALFHLRRSVSASFGTGSDRSWSVVIAQSRGDVAEPVRRTKQVVGSYVPEAIDISALSRGRVVQPSV